MGTPGDTHCSEDPLHSPSPEGKGVICSLRSSSSSDLIPTLRAVAAPTKLLLTDATEPMLTVMSVGKIPSKETAE